MMNRRLCGQHRPMAFDAFRRENMLLLKGGEVYAPEPLGQADLLLSPERILQIRPNIPVAAEYGVEALDCSGLYLAPALVDQHVHIAGGGGEEGPLSRTPQVGLGELVCAGIGAVAGLLGADGVARSVAELLAKARALEAEGLSAVIYTGSYGLPAATLTGRVLDDLVFIDKVVGAGEVAISDHRSSHPGLQALLSLAWEAHLGGMLGNKAGILHLHVGDGKAGLSPLLDVLSHSDFPMGMFVPTHINRSQRLFEQGLSYAKRGGFIDLTCGEGDGPGLPVPKAARLLLEGGADPALITCSSDAGGSNPQSPDGRGHAASLYQDFVSMVRQEGIPLPIALSMAAKNPASRLKLFPQKGCLAPGSGADILALEKGSLSIVHLVLRGRIVLRDGACLVKGKYEA